jgi:transcriptional regulator with XRE-family HTH domain
MKKLKQSQLAKELGISKSYLSMILNGQRKASPELVEKLQSVPGVHKVVTNPPWLVPSKQRVVGSNPSRDARFSYDLASESLENRP